MKHLILIAVSILILQSCARRGNPTGGPKDEDAPIIIQTFPKFNKTEFNDKEIKIYFDEYVKLNDLQKQLVVSPPLKYPAIISPQGLPTKRITIKIKDTLNPNTTYVFNFGNSIEDNNEGNVLSNFKYVFSTGKIIDTLELKGRIKDAFNNKTDEFVSVLLYKQKSFNDSVVFNRKPDYVANSLDSTTFNLTNLKAGKYRIIALKEGNIDYQYQPKDEKIAFLDSVIEIPTKQEILLTLFKKEPAFKVKKITELSKGHFLVGYQGDASNSTIEIVKLDTTPISKMPDFKTYFYQEANTDSIHYFYSYKKIDSVKFRISKDTLLQEISLKLKSKKPDSLQLASNIKGVLHPLDTFMIVGNVPFNDVDKNFFHLMEADTIPTTFSLKKKQVNQLQVLFDRKPKTRYKLTVLPKGITSIFKQENDTLKFGILTKKDTYYGSINLDINTKNLPLIVELLDSKNKVIRKKYLKDKHQVSFEKLVPGKYHIRVIVDKNKNKKWDTGNFIEHLQPEPVFYFNKTIELKENWFLNEKMNLD